MLTRLATALVVALWATGFVAIKVALDELAPTSLALLRYLVASIAFVLLLVVRRLELPRREDWLRLALLGAVGIALYNILLNTGQRTVTAGIASIVINTVPILTALLSTLWLGERVGRSGWFGSAISFAGVALIGLERSGWSGFDGGTSLCLAAACAQAIYFVLAKPLLARYHPIDLTSYATWFGCLCLLPFGGDLSTALNALDGRTIAAVLFLGLGPASLAYVAWAYVLASTEPGRASNALFLVPVLALGIGWFVLGELASPLALTGGAIAICGLAVSRLGRR